MGIEQTRIARPADQLMGAAAWFQLGKAGIELTHIVFRIEMGDDHLGGDAGAGKIAGFEDQGLGGT